MGRTGRVCGRLGKPIVSTIVLALALGALAGVAHADTVSTSDPTSAPPTTPTTGSSTTPVAPTTTTPADAAPTDPTDPTEPASPTATGPATTGPTPTAPTADAAAPAPSAAPTNLGAPGTPAVVSPQAGVVAANVGPWPSAWIWGKDRGVVSYIPGGPTQGFSDLTSPYTQGEHVTVTVDCGVASYFLPGDDTPTGISYAGQMDLGGTVGYQDFLPLTTAPGASSFGFTIPDPSLTDPHAPTTFPVVLTVGCTMSECCVTPTEKFTFMVRRDDGGGGGGGSPNHAPVAAFTATPVAPTPGQFHFVSSSTDPDVGDTLSYDWDYGDGEPHGIGSNTVHTYKKPGTFTAMLTVTDSHGATNTVSQEVTVKAPDLGISISFPGRANNDLVPGDVVLTRVTLTASADGVGALSSFAFDGAPLVVQSGNVTVSGSPELPVPSTLSLSPGASQAFDFTVTANGVGHFTLASTVRAQDAALRPVTPPTATLNGNTPQLDVTLESGTPGVDSLDLVMTVTNNGDLPISQLAYGGDAGITLRPELFPAQERGAVTLQSGPSPALPTSLPPHTAASATFHFQGTAAGSVGVVANATGQADDGVPVSDAGTGQLQVTPTGQLTFADLSPDDVKDFIIQMVQSNQAALQSEITQLETTVGQIMASALKPQPGQEPIDQGRLLSAAVTGYLKGVRDGVVGLGVTAVVTPMQYYLGNLDRPGQIAADFRDATVAAAQTVGGAADAATYGLAAPIANAFYSPTFQGDPGEALADDAKFGALLDNQAAAAGAQKLASLEATLQQQADQMSAHPYEAAESITHDVGKASAELVVGDGLAKGGTKLVGLSAGAAATSSDASYEAARRLLGSSGALENLGAGANVSLDTVEALGGITATDSAKIQGILADAQAKFGVDLELQARPSNPYSAQYINSELGALPKPEVLKVKSFTDVDVVLGADSKALGKVGVFEPKLPSQSVLDSLTPELRSEVETRYQSRLGEWNQWKDPKSDLNKAFQRASQPGGDVFTFDTPGGDAPRTYRLDVDFKVEGPNNTLTFFDKPTGRPMVSDIDFHAALDAATGRIPDASVRGQVELYLQNRFQTSGIAFGDHGITVNGFDWPGLGTDVKGTTKWLQFALEHLSPEDARALAEQWAARLGKTPDQLLQGVTPGKFVVKFRADQVTVGPGAAP